MLLHLGMSTHVHVFTSSHYPSYVHSQAGVLFHTCLNEFHTRAGLEIAGEGVSGRQEARESTEKGVVSTASRCLLSSLYTT